MPIGQCLSSLVKILRLSRAATRRRNKSARSGRSSFVRRTRRSSRPPTACRTARSIRAGAGRRGTRHGSRELGASPRFGDEGRWTHRTSLPALRPRRVRCSKGRHGILSVPQPEQDSHKRLGPVETLEKPCVSPGTSSERSPSFLMRHGRSKAQGRPPTVRTAAFGRQGRQRLNTISGEQRKVGSNDEDPATRSVGRFVSGLSSPAVAADSLTGRWAGLAPDGLQLTWLQGRAART